MVNQQTTSQSKGNYHMEISSTPRFETSFNKTTSIQSSENNISSPTAVNEGSDEINMSREALLMTEAIRTAQNTTDLRADKIAKFRAQIEADTYKVNPSAIARALLADEFDLLKL